MPYAKGFFKELPSSEIIENNGTLEDLEECAERIYEQYVSQSFDERYVVKEKDLSPIRQSEKQVTKEEKNRDEKV